MNALMELRKIYDDFKDKSEGVDPDFPGLVFGNAKGVKINKGTNLHKFLEDNPNFDI